MRSALVNDGGKAIGGLYGDIFRTADVKGRKEKR